MRPAPRWPRRLSRDRPRNGRSAKRASANRILRHHGGEPTRPAKRGRHCCRPPVAGLRSAGPPRGADPPIWFRRQPVQGRVGACPAVGHRGRSSALSKERRGSGLGGQRETRASSPFVPWSWSVLRRCRSQRSDHAIGSVTARHLASAANSRGDVTMNASSRGVLGSDRLRGLHAKIDCVTCIPRSKLRQFPFGTNRLDRCKALTFLRFLAVPSSSCRTDAVTLAESHQPENGLPAL